MVRWARGELAERADRGEYEDRLVWALTRPRLRSGERYLGPSALRACVRAKAPHVADPGPRVKLAVPVELAARVPMRGRYGDAYLHRLRDDFGRLVFSGRPVGSAPTSSFWAGQGGPIRSAAACSGGSLSALTHDATTPAITLASSHGLHVGEPLLRAQTRWPISGRDVTIDR